MTTLFTDHPLDMPMRRFVWRRRRLRAAGAACVGGALLLAWLIAGGLVDRFARLPPWVRMSMLCVLLAIAAASFMRVVILLIDRRFNRQIAAGQIEAMDDSLGERLMTVITQDELPAAQRGSPQMTAWLAAEVIERLRMQPPVSRLTWRFVRPAIVLLALMLLIAIGLLCIPSLGLPRLIARQLFPLADLPPVTTTKIDVVTGSLDLPQGQPLAVVADITNSDGPVTLLIGSDDSQLQPIAASRVFGGRYSATVKSIETDQIYRVQAGDAVSAAYHVRVMRKPGIVRLGLTLTFPDYLHTRPLTIDKSDGKIDAVRGTRVHATVVGTETLRQVTAALPQGTLPGDTTVDPAVRTLDFAVDQSGPWSLNLVSERGVTGNGPGGMRINAVEDKPPVVRLLKSDLRLAPTDIAAIPFEAADDFGLQSLRIEVASVDKPSKPQELKLPDERRLVRDVATVDLAPLAAAYGDVVSVTLVGTDEAGQTSISPPCRILISPRSIDSRAERRQAAITAARELTESAVNDPGDAPAAVRAMFRAIAATDSAETANYLQQQIDAVQNSSSLMTWAGQPNWSPEQQGAVRGAADALKRLERSEQAKAILADRENIDAAEKSTAGASQAEREATKQSIRRARREIAQREQGLQLAPDAADTPDRLKQIANEGDDAVRHAAAPSTAEIANHWANSKGPPAEADRDRVAAAAQAEVLRSDADLAWARDQQLIARAMTAVAADDKSTGQQQVRQSAEKLQAAHRDTTMRDAPNPSPAIQQQANAARQTLSKLAGDSTDGSATQPSMLEDAMSSPAALQQEHDLPMPEDGSQNAEKGPEKWHEPSDKPGQPSPADAAPETSAERQARSLDRASKDQRRLNDRTQQASPEAAKTLARQQRDVADQLKKIEDQRDEDFFQKSPADQQQALAQLQQMQKQLTDMPQQMLMARSAAQSGNPQSKQSSAASAALAKAAGALASQGGSQSGAAKQTAGDVKAMADQLQKGDLAAADAAQAKALESIAALQATLRTAQRQVVDRDPVVAARYFAEQSALAMERQPPDLVAARTSQQAASGAMERAWGQSMSRAVRDRLGRLPSFQSLLDDDLPVLSAGGTGAAPLARSPLPQWGRLRTQRSADVAGSDLDFQPAGYEGALSAYFESLGKARSRGGLK